MFCFDDKHPDDLVAGHIDRLAAAALQKGHNLFDVLRCACINPCVHYNLFGPTRCDACIQPETAVRVGFTVDTRADTDGARTSSVVSIRLARILARQDVNRR